MEKVIEVINLNKAYPLPKKQRTDAKTENQAVRGISFAVEKGEIFGILGPNGAGKTTTLDVLECLKQQSSGQVTVLGFDNLKQIQEIKKRIGEFLAEPKKEHEGEDVIREIFFILSLAANQAMQMENAGIEPEDIFGALMRTKDKNILKLMAIFNIEEGDIENVLRVRHFGKNFARLSHIGHLIGESRKERHRVMNRAWTAKPTPFLDQISTGLTDEARSGSAGLLGSARVAKD